MTTQEKRAQFAKDLDKLVSGDYVLVPKKPTKAMLLEGYERRNQHPEYIYVAMINAAQEQV